MHKVSLQNYATGLPHQKGQKCQGPRPLGHKHTVLAASPNPARICFFCEKKERAAIHLQVSAWNKTPGPDGWGPRTCCLIPNYPVCLCAAGLCVRSRLCMYVCMYMWTKKQAVWGLTTGKSPVSVINCSLVKFNGQKRGLLCQAIRSVKEIWNYSINGTEKGSWKIVLR